jgi:hypothetical protein
VQRCWTLRLALGGQYCVGSAAISNSERDTFFMVLQFLCSLVCFIVFRPDNSVYLVGAEDLSRIKDSPIDIVHWVSTLGGIQNRYQGTRYPFFHSYFSSHHSFVSCLGIGEGPKPEYGLS